MIHGLGLTRRRVHHRVHHGGNAGKAAVVGA